VSSGFLLGLLVAGGIHFADKLMTEPRHWEKRWLNGEPCYIVPLNWPARRPNSPLP
jgi:hypothetical protein